MYDDKERMKKKEKIKRFKEKARKTFLVSCEELGNILIHANQLDEETIIDIVEKSVIYLKLISEKVIDKIMNDMDKVEKNGT